MVAIVSRSECYRRGAYKAVWRELDHSWIDVKSYCVPEPSQDEVEDVMRQTFKRVASNVDRLIERLRDIGYAFECEREDEDIAAPENLPLLTPDGGISLLAVFAPSFEHKANVSGAINYHIYLPSERRDPIVFAEAVRLPFADYLRRCFARGGFYGIPRKVREHSPMERAVEPNIWLPQNPAFESLAADMVRF